MKKTTYFLIVFILFAMTINVYAIAPDLKDPNFSQSNKDDGGGTTYIPPSISVDDGDYELVCTYSDGAELTITRDNIYIINSSNSIDASSNSGIKFHLTSDQIPSRDSNGKITKSNASKLLDSGKKCPTRLYLYKVPQQKDENVEEGTAVEDVYNYYYSTKTGIASSIAGTTTTNHWYCLWMCSSTTVDAEEIDAKISLVSEEVNLTTSKSAMICDYQTVGQNSGSQTASIYIYVGVSFLEVGNRITTLAHTHTSCPAQLSSTEIEKDNPNKRYLAINDPTPRIVGNVLSGNYEYDSIRFIALVGNGNNVGCTSENGGKVCTTFQYIGTRNGPPESGTESDVCELLGNETINVINDIVSWMQILVPALMIILIGVDIAKMVLAGNLDEELPKKKKSIIIRLIVMVLFFFIPTITTLIIKLLNESGVVNVGEIECLFK